jgi:hypothetical protein
MFTWAANAHHSHGFVTIYFNILLKYVSTVSQAESVNEYRKQAARFPI